MTRKEEIIEQGISYTLQVCPVCIAGDAFSDAMRDFNRNKAFEAGAKWADEHPNLEYLWHDASEEPEEYPIICQDEFNNVWAQNNLKDYVDGWKEFKECECITRWAYTSDLLPKGGEKCL